MRGAALSAVLEQTEAGGFSVPSREKRIASFMQLDPSRVCLRAGGHQRFRNLIQFQSPMLLGRGGVAKKTRPPSRCEWSGTPGPVAECVEGIVQKTLLGGPARGGLSGGVCMADAGLACPTSVFLLPPGVPPHEASKRERERRERVCVCVRFASGRVRSVVSPGGEFYNGGGWDKDGTRRGR